MKKIDKNIIFLGGLSFCIFVFYLFYVNFSIDTIILFLSNKIFFGKWVAKGVFPWFNPHIFLGTPVAFDVGIGSFHPFNLFFLLPYPVSFALWMGATSLLFLTGFYFLFKKHAKTNTFALLLTLILFFSGSGIFRASNPTILLVIAHYGLFLFSLCSLKKQSQTNYLFPLGVGILLTVSGHVQFVFYGYLLAVVYAWLFKVAPFKKIIILFLLLGITTFWYFLFSLPLVFDSTRLTTNKDYTTTGNNSLFQYVELFLPYIFGYIRNGSNWGPGPTYTIVISLFYSFGVVIAVLRQNRFVKLLFLVIIAASLGLINLPFFRGAGQVTILLHILGVLYTAQEEKYLFNTILKAKWVKPFLIFTAAISLFIGIFAILPFFSTLFIKGYKFMKHGHESLFFDVQTVHAIGGLIALSFAHLLLFCVAAFYLVKRKKLDYAILAYVVLEGMALVYFHNYFIPSAILTQKQDLTLSRTSNMYRIQTAADLVPYFGISTYMGDLLLRPPFSKETAIFNAQEEKNLTYLKNLFSYIPSTWVMTTSYDTVQGFSTFMIASLANNFAQPSKDFEIAYKYIIERNALFAQNKQTTSVNSITSGHLTLLDPRWEELGVRYFISDRPLKKYTLLEKSNGRYIYENSKTLPIYRIVGMGFVNAAVLYDSNPNQWKFTVSKRDVGREFQMVMNPGGFIATLNGKEVPIQKEKFLLRVAILKGGDLVVRYSPIKHLQETVRAFLKAPLRRSSR